MIEIWRRIVVNPRRCFARGQSLVSTAQSGQLHTKGARITLVAPDHVQYLHDACLENGLKPFSVFVTNTHAMEYRRSSNYCRHTDGRWYDFEFHDSGSDRNAKHKPHHDWVTVVLCTPPHHPRIPSAWRWRTMRDRCGQIPCHPVMSRACEMPFRCALYWTNFQCRIMCNMKNRVMLVSSDCASCIVRWCGTVRTVPVWYSCVCSMIKK